MEADVLKEGLNYVKDMMGIMYDSDDVLIENKLKTAENWLLNEILYEPEFKVKSLSTELTLICERVRYEMSNSLDIFQKNYANDIQNVVSKHAYNDYISKNGGV